MTDEWVLEGVDARRLAKAQARLRNSDFAVAWLDRIGLDLRFALEHGLGVEHEDENGLRMIHIVRGREGRRRLASLVVDARGEMHASTTGAPSTLWSRAYQNHAHVVVAPDVVSMWRLARAFGAAGFGGRLLVAPSHPGVPVEWRDAAFWVGFQAVTVIGDPGSVTPVAAAVAAKVPDASLALPRGRPNWTTLLHPRDGVGTEVLDQILDRGISLAEYAGGGSVSRRDVVLQDLHAADSSGRLYRAILVEEERSGDGGSIDYRLRPLVVRSDGNVLEVRGLHSPPGTAPRERLNVLSDGTRLRSVPTRSCCCRWSCGSAMRFAAGSSEGETADTLLGEVASVVARAVGIAQDAANASAAFVLMSHLHQLFEGLRVPLFHSGSPVAGATLLQLLAGLSHSGLVRDRSRASVLAHAADETGGAILLNEPGPLSGPMGLTETGRFLVSSSVRGSSWDHVGGSGRRSLRVFGPRAVFAAQRPGKEIRDILVPVDLGQHSGRVRGVDAADLSSLVDRIYCWSMSIAAEVPSWVAGGGGAIDAILSLTTRSETPQSVLAPPEHRVVETTELVEQAFGNCLADGKRILSMTQLMLEIRLLGGGGAECSPERVGRWLSAHPRVVAAGSMGRRRLYGQISRLYQIDADVIADDGDNDVFAFCRANLCSSCRYDKVCEAVVPGLKTAKPSLS